MWTYLYTDNTEIFVAPFRADIDKLASVLHDFGDATSLCAIWYEFGGIHQMRRDQPCWCPAELPGGASTFPMKYLGLPLYITHLQEQVFWPLEDKVAARLVPWQGRHVTTAGHMVLVKLVFISHAIFHLTSFRPHMKTLNNSLTDLRISLSVTDERLSVKQALSLNALIDQIDFAQLQSADHITEFVNLWAMLEHSETH
jgi:hypothetical protein